MSAAIVTRLPRRRGAFGLDERRWPDPARVEAALRDVLMRHLPDVWAVTQGEPEPDPSGGPTGRTLALLLPRGHVALLRIERDAGNPSLAARALAARCLALGIPHALVSSVAEGRAAMRRFGVEPPPRPAAGPTLASLFTRR